MIYVCIPAHDAVETVGLVLWKVRQVFEEFSREYHILVVDDGSSDGTAETLDAYQGALPLAVVRHPECRGYAASLETLMREALARSDRPKRDCLLTLPADFSVSPAAIPALLKRFESGADVVVGETVAGDASLGRRLVRRSAPWLLRPGLTVPGVRDITSGVCAVRLIALKRCFRNRGDRLLETDGACAGAELLGRVAADARQIVAVPLPREAPGAARHAEGPLRLAMSLLRAGRRLRIPAPDAGARRPAVSA